MAAISLNDVLDIKYLGQWDWAPDGDRMAYIWDDGGVTDLWILDPDTVSYRKISSAKDGVSMFAFNRVTGSLCFIQDGAIYTMAKDETVPHIWISPTEKVSAVAWSPDGDKLAFVKAGKLTVFFRGQHLFKGFDVPGNVSGGGIEGGQPLYWSPDSNLLVYSFGDQRKHRHFGICDMSGKLLYRTIDDEPSILPTWVDESTIVFARGRKKGTEAELFMIDVEQPADGTCTARVHEPRSIYYVHTDGLGNLLPLSMKPSPDGKIIAMLLENDGWAHLYGYFRESGEMKQLTTGECEDFAHAGDEPMWSPDGKLLLFASNKGEPHERHLWVFDPATQKATQLEKIKGTNSLARWSPDGRKIGFQHCDTVLNMDLWMMDYGHPQTAKQLTFSMPPVWVKENMSEPEHVTYKGAQGWDIHGFVTKPQNFDPKKKYKAIVWVHGGPVRQMRQGFNPLHSYAVFYAYHQYLAHKGYVSISINYRGGIGYGRKFRMGLHHKMGVDDVVDVVNAGSYLKSLPYVDASKVAVWGLSYGGYMTLHSLTQYPEAFCMGINFAGIWDFSQWTYWKAGMVGDQGGLFNTFFGGFPEESPELYRIGSPVTYAENMKKPLINFMGTADKNVDFEQMDRIVLDMVKLGKTYEAYYYPNEVHMFRWRRTWADAFPKAEREFEKYMG
jgi:dipeptidyl aminopeptidase/acylaminoacyl peptidase